MTAISTIATSNINGVIDTGRNVMDNIENIANSAQCWVTYDITQGKWSVVINQAGASTHSFDDSNIVGSIDLVTTQLDRLYNAVEVQYPDNDLEDANGFVRADMLPGDLLQNEPENVLRLTYPLLNDQIQALHLGLTELKQSRLDKVITFTTDYTSYGVRAGDIIDVTADTYGFTNKLFRVLQLEEVDREDGYIDIRITANEYDSSIYTHNLSRYTLSNQDGIFGLGDIGAMDPITVTLTEVDQLPSILIESAFNAAGAPVTGVEIWVYSVTDPTEIANWNNPALYPDEDRDYRLLTTKFSVDETFALGGAFDHTVYDLGAGNWLIKIRPINAQTTGPFTTPGALTTYDPDVSSAVFDDINNNIGNIPVELLNVTNFYSGLATDTTTPPLSGIPTLRPMQQSTFVCTRSGVYNANFLFEQSSSAGSGGRLGIGGGTIFPSEHRDYIAVGMEIFELPSLVSLGTAGSGGDGAFYWTDFVGSLQVTLVAGVSYRIDFFYWAYTQLLPGSPIDGTLNLTVSKAT